MDDSCSDNKKITSHYGIYGREENTSSRTSDQFFGFRRMLVLTWNRQPSLLLRSRSYSTLTLTLMEHRLWWRHPPAQPLLKPRTRSSITRSTWKRQRRCSMQSSCSRRRGREVRSRTCEVGSINLVFCYSVGLWVGRVAGCLSLLPVSESQSLTRNCQSVVELCNIEEFGESIDFVGWCFKMPKSSTVPLSEADYWCYF